MPRKRLASKRSQSAVAQQPRKHVQARAAPKAQLRTVPKVQPRASAPALRPGKAVQSNSQSMRAERKIPESAGSKPLHVKDKMKGDERIQGNLKKKSRWYQAILEPSQGGGIKMPDDVAVQTGTLQCSYETAFTANLNGLGGFRTLSLHPNQTSGVNGSNFEKLATGASVSNITWASPGFFPTNPVLKAYSTAVRVVSAGLYVEPEVSLASAQGEMFVGYDPMTVFSSPALDDYRNRFGTAIMPLNVCKPMKTTWTPVSRGEQTYSAFYDPRELFGNADGNVPEWMLFVLVQGVVPASVFRVRVVVNYEFIPFLNSIDIVSANPSPCDSTEVDLVESWVSETPPSRPTNNNVLSQAPGARVLDDMGPQDGGPTGFGMFFDVVTELLPFALSLI